MIKSQLFKILMSVPLAFWPGFNRSAQSAYPGALGTSAKRFRSKGEWHPSGNKLSRMAAEHRLDGSNPGGVAAGAFRNDKINRNLARLANEEPDNNESAPTPIERQRVRGW